MSPVHQVSPTEPSTALSRALPQYQCTDVPPAPDNVSTAGLYSQGLLYGGPVVLFWSWLITGAFTVLVGLSMAELSSAFPVSGGLYYWAFAVGQRHGPLASYLVGWLNLLGQVSIMQMLKPLLSSNNHQTGKCLVTGRLLLLLETLSR